MNPLFDDGSDSDTNTRLTTNRDFAKTFNRLREKELFKRLKIEGSDNSDSSSDSDSSTDNEDADNLEFNKNFYKTLASLKCKDPKIYDKNTKFFTEEFDDESSKKTKSKKAKPMKLDEYERKTLFETGGRIEDAEEEFRPTSPTLAEEERNLRNDFKKALNDNDSDDENELGGMFVKRDKPREELEHESEQYTKWLAGQKADIGEDATVLNPLKEYWADPKLSRNETFLRDYILNNGYVDEDYDRNVEDPVQLSEDEEILDNQAEFEQKYNFRYEEPDQDFIKRYPRTIAQSVRKVDESRSVKRAEVKERKEREKEQKKRELEVLKAFKKKEIEEKIQKLKQVTGNETLAFGDDDLEGDFNPEEYDKKMKTIFDEEYYQVDEGDQKPECDIDELKFEDWDNYDPSKEQNDNDYQPHCEDDEFNMDCEFNETDRKKDIQNEIIESTSGRRSKGRKRSSKFMDVLKKDRPVFDPEDETTYAEYIDEYYKLDYEDMIGDVPCRFKYVETVANDFGLTTEEIFLAKNKELNQWASLKKAVQIRPEHVEKNERFMYQRKSANFDLKKKVFRSIYGEPSDEEKEDDDEGEVAKPVEEPAAKKKKKNKKRKLAAPENSTIVREEQITPVSKKVKINTETTNKAEETITKPNIEEVPVKSKKNKKNKEIVKIEEVTVIEKSPVDTNKKKNKKNKEIVKIEEVTVIEKSPVVTNKKKTKKLEKLEKVSKEIKNLPEMEELVKITANKKIKNKKQSNNKNNAKFNKNSNQKTSSDISDNRLRAFGINPKKFHNKIKYGNQTETNKTSSNKK